MEQLRNHDDAWPFIDRVEEEKAPEYYKIVKQPMYITKMEDRVSNGYYVTFELFDEDFKLMMYNCRLYNDHKSGGSPEYGEMADRLEKEFNKLRNKDPTAKKTKKSTTKGKKKRSLLPLRPTENSTRCAEFLLA